MSHYRAYIIGPDGHFIEAKDLDCANDTAAVEAAKKLVTVNDVEVWQADRLIMKLETHKN
jgi:hypothetical protein